MQTDTTSAASAIFAANRAQGVVRFDVHQVDGVTRRRHLHESGSLRVRFPSPEADGLSAVFVNTAGGVAGGDRFEIDIAAGEGARLTLTTAAAEKIYRAESNPAQLERIRMVSDRFGGEVGISAWNGFAMARFCAQDAARLRADMAAVLGSCG